MPTASTISRDSIISQSPGQLSCPIEGEVVAMCLDGGKYYRIDAVGAVAWECLSKPIRVSDLCARLRDQFAVEEAKCEADVISFLTDLRSFGLVKVADE